MQNFGTSVCREAITTQIKNRTLWFQTLGKVRVGDFLTILKNFETFFSKSKLKN